MNRLLAAFILLLAPLLPAQSPADQPQPIVLRDITVLNPADTPALQPHRDVLIANGRIVSITPYRRTQRFPGARQIPLPGRYLLPGFIDMHAHVLASPRDPRDGHVLPAPSPETTRQLLRTLLAFGITDVRDTGDPTARGIEVRQLIREGKLVGPDIYLAGTIINTSRPGPEFVELHTADAICAEIRNQKSAGVDYIKLYSGLPPDLLSAGIQCAHAAGLKAIAHTGRTTWSQAADAGIDFITHGIPWSTDLLPKSKQDDGPEGMFWRVWWLENVALDSPAAKEMTAKLVAHNISIDPTLITYYVKFFGDKLSRDTRHLSLVPKQYRDGWAAGSFTAGWTPAQYQQAQQTWPRALAFVRMLHDAHVPLTVGTDTPQSWTIPGLSLHQEMHLLHQAGISNQEVLRMATTNAAEALGLTQELGRGESARDEINGSESGRNEANGNQSGRSGLGGNEANGNQSERSGFRENESDGNESGRNQLGRVAPNYRANLVVLRQNPITDIEYTEQIELVIKRGQTYKPADLLRDQSK